MDVPKISVLIPMYNRRHYIEDCVNSVLSQTFQDFEIVIRDDGSTDGSAEFVEQRYANELSSGRLRLLRNKKNRGEYLTTFRLLNKDAFGDYMYLLHSDDMLLPQAFQHLMEVAMATNADVIHSIGRINTPEGGVITKDTPLSPYIHDGNPVRQVTVMPSDFKSRFLEWASNGTFVDIPYNLFKREFFAENELLVYPHIGGFNLLKFLFILKAPVFVKTPAIFYVYRDSPDSISRTAKKKDPSEVIEGYIKWMMNDSRGLDAILSEMDIIKDNEELRRFVKFKFLTEVNDFVIKRIGIYQNGVSSELWEACEKTFRDFLGADGFYPALLFTWVQLMNEGLDIRRVMIRNVLNSLENISAPPKNPHNT